MSLRMKTETFCLNCGRDREWLYNQTSKYCTDRCRIEFLRKQRIERHIRDGKQIIAKVKILKEINRCRGNAGLPLHTYRDALLKGII